MAFTTQLLAGYVLSDVVKVVNMYLSPKNTIFKEMCELGLIEQVLEYCQHNYDDFRDRYLDIYNMGLYYACESGNADIAKLMIKKGATNLKCTFENACANGHLEIINVLIEDNGDKIIKENKETEENDLNIWNHGLDYACYGGYNENHRKRFANNTARLEIIKLMIKKGADDFNNGLTRACSGKNIEIIEYLITQGANDWNDGFLEACNAGIIKIVELMIIHGKHTLDWDLGLYYACSYGHIKIVKLLIAYGAHDWNRGLSAACYSDQSDVVELMIECGASYCDHCSEHDFN
jgi:ankyrin repeat protein